MIVSINQPAYLPWLGYFQRIAVSDLHVVLDHVQFEKNSFVNRNRIRSSGGAVWLTVPVRTAGRFGRLPIDELEIDSSSNWRRKHWQTIAQAYRRAPFFEEHALFFESVYEQEWRLLADLCGALTGYLLEAFAISTPLRRSSGLGAGAAKDELVLEICRVTGASLYLSGQFGRSYLHEERFAAHGIDVVYQDYRHPVYPQVYSPFVSHLSAVDLLFNCGPESRDVLLAGQEVVAR